jgi:hypothetical protein
MSETTGDRPYVEILARHIAGRIFPHIGDLGSMRMLEVLLIEFAAEIKRSTIEP